ncbi:MAG TPA: transporter substrate-binding domain-containing protein [Lichenihabitans sp.]|jgi:general L-amino acid transport system substrate-binding protein|nr:transporter substrate-binding domain-containing protein [Lichenihabitans sp.]
MRMRLTMLVVAVLLGATGRAEAGPVLDHVKSAGTLSCGLIHVPEDYGRTDTHGSLDALASEICRAVAAAVLKDSGRMTPAIFPDEAHGFAALAAGTIDLLIGASPSHAIAVARHLRFGHPVFYDGDGFLVSRASGVSSFADLAGKQVCFIGGTPPEAVLDAAAARRGIEVMPFPWSEDGEMDVGLLTGHCAAVVDSVSRLANIRARFQNRIKDFDILPDRLSADPVAPAMRDDDPQWAAVVDATIEALLLTERARVTKADAAILRTTEDPVLRVLGGLVPGVEEKDVDRDWAVRALSAVGNYAEIYERTVGPGSPLDLPRGNNALWSDGGLMLDDPPR